MLLIYFVQTIVPKSHSSRIDEMQEENAGSIITYEPYMKPSLHKHIFQ